MMFVNGDGKEFPTPDDDIHWTEVFEVEEGGPRTPASIAAENATPVESLLAHNKDPIVDGNGTPCFPDVDFSTEYTRDAELKLGTKLLLPRIWESDCGAGRAEHRSAHAKVSGASKQPVRRTCADGLV